MTTWYRLNFYNNCNDFIHVERFPVLADEDIRDGIEKALYITKELTPVNHYTWKNQLLTPGFTYFTYHMTKVFKIVYVYGNHDIDVYECSQEVANTVLKN